MGNNQSKYYRRQANQAKRYTIIILSRKNKQSLHPGRNRSTDRKTTKKPHYRISRNSTNTTTILTGANTTSSNKQYSRIRQKLKSLLYAGYKLEQEILPLCISKPATAKSITERKKRNNALKPRKKSTKTTWKTQRNSILLKENETLTYQQHGRLTQNFENLKDKSNRKLNEKKRREKQTHLRLAQTHIAPIQSCLVTRQLAVHGSQLSLQLGNLTVQATNC